MVRSNGVHMTRHPRHRRRSTAGQRIQRKTTAMSNNFKELAGIVRHATQDQLERLGDDATIFLEMGRTKMKQVERSTAQFIRERPITSVLIAAGIGCVVGRFWVRR
jgi:ElaB/YqjD/DUF883 family membrane-anchored ribosome-binding protein